MSLGFLMLLLAAVSAALAFFLAFLFLTGPDRALAFTKHRLDRLPLILGNRFITIGLIMAAAVISRNPLAILVVFGAATIGPVHDAMVYRSAGSPWVGHAFVGVVFALVTLLALLSLFNSGAA